VSGPVTIRRLPARRVRWVGRPQHGFTLVEMLVATAIMLAVTAATFQLMNPAQGIFAAQPEVSDMQQRLRIGVDALYTDILMAGAGPYAGAGVGTLGHYVAAIVPYRLGNLAPDPPAAFNAQTITLAYVPATSAQTTLAEPMLAGSADIRVAAQPGCPRQDQLCGFENGMKVLIFDGSGSWDAFSISALLNDPLRVQHRGEGLNKPYDAGAFLSQIIQHTYWLKADTAAETFQLMCDDGSQTDLPIADNVIGLTFDYYGDPSPALLRPQQTPATTYGPTPPELGVDNTADSWPAGENCVFMVSGGQQVPRMATLGAANGPLIKLDPVRLTDGPWCPDADASNRYDVDLLRIRKVRVTLRVQVANKAFRGPAGALFARGGTSAGGERYIPDQEIRFDVTPRNLNRGR
jgi:prepilin-type N-terminal cleavage/methylation domain-containing protein